METLVSLGLLLSLIAPLTVWAQTPLPSPRAASGAAAQPAKDGLDDFIARMTSADKVGQLFLVTFPGNEAGLSSEAAWLVQELRVGGVILSSASGNIRNEEALPAQVAALTQSLQELAFTDSRPIVITSTMPITFTAPVVEVPGEPAPTPVVLSTVVTITRQITYPAQGIPLLVAVSQEGDGYPYSTLRSGFTALPSPMAVGATWDESNAEAVGVVVGEELSAVGVNLLLGPSLDVLVQPRTGPSDHLSARVFGGDPYWAGRMGRAYVRGVHEGSNWQVATVAMHLPGFGGSDRSLQEELATVDKSLQDLRLIELPPFFAVAQSKAITDTTDAFMTAHIRYRGFQGNIRYVTPPISLHAQGMEQVLALPELATWRENGGVLVSDSLGVPAIRRYFSPNLDSFPHRQIALDAFLAGNDLLNLSSFSLHDSWEEQKRNVEDTILFFRSRYQADSNFRSRVDQSVRRILQLKRRLYPEFSLEATLPAAAALSAVGTSESVTAQIAKQAITLLYPAADELALRMPRAPRSGEDILIFTDARRVTECAGCPSFYLLDPEALRDTILELYGPQATGQVAPERVTARTFADLHSFLASGSPNLNQALHDAEWIVFAMLDPSAEDAASSALKQFLRERAAGEAQRLIVLAFQAPYHLDTTEVSKLTAYFGVFAKSQPLVEMAVRSLFLEFTPTGRSPVTVEGVGYDLVRQLSPDPAQVIEVLTEHVASSEGTPAPLNLAVGDPLAVRTSVILDHNGHPVPDGTPVVFRYTYQGEGGLGGQKEAVTIDGEARTTITLEREGELQIAATSDPCRNTRPLVVRLSGGTTLILTPTPTPTLLPTPTPTLTPTPTRTPTLTPTLTPTPPLPEESGPPPAQPRLRWGDLILGLLGMACAGGVTYLSARSLRCGSSTPGQSLRFALWSGICGLVGYLLYGLALPGTRFLEQAPPGLRGLLIGLVCGILPLGWVAWLCWQKRRSR